METRKLVVVLASLVVVLASTVVVLAVHRHGGTSVVVGSGHAVSVTRTPGRFRAVDLRGAANVVIRVAPKASVVVRGDDNIVPRVHTQVAAGTLVISDPGSFRTNTPLTVTVTTPALTGAALDGAGRLDLHGATSSLALRLAGAGTIDAAALVAQSVRVDLAGTGIVTVTARRSLDATVAGTGSIVYHGAPAHVRTHISGTGTVTAG